MQSHRGEPTALRVGQDTTAQTPLVDCLVLQGNSLLMKTHSQKTHARVVKLERTRLLLVHLHEKLACLVASQATTLILLSVM